MSGEICALPNQLLGVLYEGLPALGEESGADRDCGCATGVGDWVCLIDNARAKFHKEGFSLGKECGCLRKKKS